MNKNIQNSDLPALAEQDSVHLAQMLMPALAPIAPQAERELALRSRLLERVALSARQSRAFSTIRAGDGHWEPLADGVRHKVLPSDAGVSARMLEFSAASALVPAATGAAEEWLVLGGEIALDGEVLGAGDYLFVGAASRPAAVRSAAGASVYVRASMPGASAFGDLSERRLIHVFEDSGWEPFCPGVLSKLMCRADYQGTRRVSMVLRLQAGASAPQHSHPAGEECVMVQGDVFLGDLLLRQGEFQWAPAGTEHGQVFSDTGCMLFFHGAIDPQVLSAD